MKRNPGRVRLISSTEANHQPIKILHPAKTSQSRAGEGTPPVQAAAPKIDTFIPELNARIAGLSPKECLRVAEKYEDHAAALRAALGHAGLGPKTETNCRSVANFYLKIGLSKHQIGRLKLAAKALLRPKYRSSSTAAFYLLNVALSNLELMELLLRKDRHESESNVFAPLPEFFWERKARVTLQNLN